MTCRYRIAGRQREVANFSDPEVYSRHQPRRAPRHPIRLDRALATTNDCHRAGRPLGRARNPNRDTALISGLRSFFTLHALSRIAAIAAGRQAGQYFALRQIAMKAIPHSTHRCSIGRSSDILHTIWRDCNRRWRNHSGISPHGRALSTRLTSAEAFYISSPCNSQSL